MNIKKSICIYFHILSFSAISLLCRGQEVNPYFSKWDKLFLSGDSLPVIMPYNRIVDPAGDQIYFGDNNMENHALDCALSPDKKILAIEGRYRIVFYNVESGKIISELKPGSDKELTGARNTYSGIKWYQKGNQQYVLWSLIGSNNRSYVVKAKWDGQKATITNRYLFDATDPSPVALPNELEILKEKSGDYLIVVLNGNNQVVKIKIETGEIIWKTNVGVAPYGLVATKGKLFVTNWGG